LSKIVKDEETSIDYALSSKKKYKIRV